MRRLLFIMCATVLIPVSAVYLSLAGYPPIVRGAYYQHPALAFEAALSHHVVPKRFDSQEAAERIRQVGLTPAAKPKFLYLAHGPEGDRPIVERFFKVTTKFPVETDAAGFWRAPVNGGLSFVEAESGRVIFLKEDAARDYTNAPRYYEPGEAAIRLHTFAPGLPAERRKYFERMTKGFTNYGNAKAVRKQVPFRLRAPSSEALPPNPKVLLVPNGGIKFARVEIYYGDIVHDISFFAEAREVTPDLTADAQLLGRAEVQKLTVRNHDAVGWEHYSDNVPSGVDTVASRIAWWEDGIFYQIIGSAGGNPTSLAALKELAEGMR